jgi:UDP-N-acetylmuramoyl-tripeptide--D-alanyl-D-alanine ligase
LKGEHFDGNDYIEQVLDSGVEYAVGDRNTLPENNRIILVEDVLQTLQDLANFHRSRMSAKIIAVTGTNGKTTTKELMAAVLSSKYNVLYTEGNLNNHIGVPLTLLKLRKEHEFGIIEMGANHPGEINELCEIADPDYGLITNIGKAHLEGFGSLDGIIQTKTELYRYLQQKDGIIFENSENVLLKKFHDNHSSVVRYGIDSENFVSGEAVCSAPYLKLRWKDKNTTNTVQTHLIGNYNLENVLSAICIGKFFEVPNDKINESLTNYVPSNNRSQRKTTENNKLILDAYNANPSSMSAALENFNALDVSPKMVILGEMKELGEYSSVEHRKILNQLIKYKIDKVLLVGNSFHENNLNLPHWKQFPDTDDLMNYLQTEKIKGFHILIKGSRSNRLERIIDWL